MATPDRQELVRNAIAFLADPSSQSSSLVQRIQFLEAKGLTAPEIEEAMKQAGPNQAAQSYRQPYQASYPQVYGPSLYGLPPPSNQWDWRDYFITAVLTGTVTLGVVSLFQKYLLPNLRPPAASVYEEDRDALTAQFDVAEALLKQIQTDTAGVRLAVEEQERKVEKITQEVEAVVKEMCDGESKTRDEMREIRDEIDNVREMLPKMIEKNKASQTQSLAELQQELKSLKALLLSRGTGLSTAPASPLSLPGRPSIPAWQLAGPSQTSDVNGSDQVLVALPSLGSVVPLANGKGKETDPLPETSGSS